MGEQHDKMQQLLTKYKKNMATNMREILEEMKKYRLEIV